MELSGEIVKNLQSGVPLLSSAKEYTEWVFSGRD